MQLKWLNPSPTRVRYISVRSGKGHKTGLLIGTVAVSGEDDEISSRGATLNRNSEASKPGDLLRSEMEEINNWARLGAQLYFGWFAVVLTFNALGVGWLFTHNETLPRFARMVFLIFIGFDLLGIIVTYFVRKHMLDSDLRIKELIGSMTQHQVEARQLRPRSPVPRAAINTVFAFTSAGLLIFLLFWLTLFLL
jgi:hypothetical protein